MFNEPALSFYISRQPLVITLHFFIFVTILLTAGETATLSAGNVSDVFLAKGPNIFTSTSISNAREKSPLNPAKITHRNSIFSRKNPKC